MDFASEYKRNVQAEMIKVICPICKVDFLIYPEHLGEACCGVCYPMHQEALILKA